jgi:hypothetical protein
MRPPRAQTKSARRAATAALPVRPGPRPVCPRPGPLVPARATQRISRFFHLPFSILLPASIIPSSLPNRGFRNTPPWGNSVAAAWRQHLELPFILLFPFFLCLPSHPLRHASLPQREPPGLDTGSTPAARRAAPIIPLETEGILRFLRTPANESNSQN